MSTPGDFTEVSEIFFGSEEGRYYTIITEILNPGSYYSFKRNTYLAEYKNGNILVNKKILKKEEVVLDEDAKETKNSTSVIRNKGALEKLLKRNVKLSMYSFGNNGKYEVKDDGIYEISGKNNTDSVKIFSKEDINKKITDICSKDYCSEDMSYNNEDIEVLSGYYNGKDVFYIIKINYDIAGITFIMKKTDG
jgi:hypothetical protein